jgi:hypothetical protein
MSSPARISRIYDLRDAQTRDRPDVVVLQAITNVTDRQPVDGWWDASPGGRTQAIYEEIRRLDQARVNGTSALAAGMGTTSQWDGMTGCAAHHSPCLVDAVAISNITLSD